MVKEVFEQKSIVRDDFAEAARILLDKGRESIAICTIIYFSHPIIKISWKKIGLLKFIECLEKNISCPSKAMQKGNFKHNSSHFKPNCWQVGEFHRPSERIPE